MNRLLVLANLLFLTLPALAADPAPHIQACDQALQDGTYDQAAAHADQALKLAPDSRHAYLCLARAQGAAGKHAEALAALQQARKLATQPIEQMVALTLIGNEHLATGVHQEARVAYQQSLDLARRANNKRFQHINLNQLGTVLQADGDVAGALELYRQGYPFAANDNERADSNARIAAAHSLLGEHDKAIEYQLKAMLAQERSGDLAHYADANVELGRICLVAGKYADAEKWLGKFLNVIPQANAPYWEAKGRLMLGRVKAAQGKSGEAAKQYARGRALAEQAGDRQLLEEIGSAEAGKPL